MVYHYPCRVMATQISVLKTNDQVVITHYYDLIIIMSNHKLAIYFKNMICHYPYGSSYVSLTLSHGFELEPMLKEKWFVTNKPFSV